MNVHKSKNNICPLPIKWNAIYNALEEARKKSANPIPPSPIPLILAGWSYSTDFDKRIRWEETIQWAEQHGFEHLLQGVNDDEWYTS